MKKVLVNVETINDDPSDFDYLFLIWNSLNNDNLDVVFNFSRSKFLQQNAVAFLGGVAKLVEYRRGKAHFLWDTLKENILTNLAQNGFGEAFGLDVSPWQGNSIPYRQDLYLNEDNLTRYLKTKWLDRNWVQMSDTLKDVITAKVLECYLNSFEHSKSPIGVFSCGQHYPSLEVLKISIADFGIGIPNNVRSYFNLPDYDSTEALKWAIKAGNTTNPSGLGRGLGLDFIKKFVQINKGQIDIYSHDGYAFFDETREYYRKRTSFFGGTIINITLQCDENLYILTSESSPPDFF